MSCWKTLNPFATHWVVIFDFLYFLWAGFYCCFGYIGFFENKVI